MAEDFEKLARRLLDEPVDQWPVNLQGLPVAKKEIPQPTRDRILMEIRRAVREDSRENLREDLRENLPEQAQGTREINAEGSTSVVPSNRRRLYLIAAIVPIMIGLGIFYLSGSGGVVRTLALAGQTRLLVEGSPPQVVSVNANFKLPARILADEKSLLMLDHDGVLLRLCGPGSYSFRTAGFWGRGLKIGLKKGEIGVFSQKKSAEALVWGTDLLIYSMKGTTALLRVDAKGETISVLEGTFIIAERRGGRKHKVVGGEAATVISVSGSPQVRLRKISIRERLKLFHLRRELRNAGKGRGLVTLPVSEDDVPDSIDGIAKRFGALYEIELVDRKYRGFAVLSGNTLLIYTPYGMIESDITRVKNIRELEYNSHQ